MRQYEGRLFAKAHEAWGLHAILEVLVFPYMHLRNALSPGVLPRVPRGV